MNNLLWGAGSEVLGEVLGEVLSEVFGKDLTRRKP